MSKKDFPALDERKVSERLRRGFSEMEKHENGEDPGNNGVNLHHCLSLRGEEELAEEFFEEPLFDENFALGIEDEE